MKRWFLGLLGLFFDFMLPGLALSGAGIVQNLILNFQVHGISGEIIERYFVSAVWINAIILILIFLITFLFYFNGLKIRDYTYVEKLASEYKRLFWICLVISIILDFIITVSVMHIWVLLVINLKPVISLILYYIVVNFLSLLCLQGGFPPSRFKHLPLIYKLVKED